MAELLIHNKKENSDWFHYGETTFVIRTSHKLILANCFFNTCTAQNNILNTTPLTSRLIIKVTNWTCLHICIVVLLRLIQTQRQC